MNRAIKTIGLELLAPARNADIGIEAVRHGADAVYIGASSHGARASAANSVDDIARLVEYAHRFGAKVYVTINTIVRDSEIEQVEQLVAQLYRIGVDALIVQDMALLSMKIPPIALHASTQCDIRDADKARMLAAAGFEQIVVARELTLEQMAVIARAVPDTVVEAFVHGALCVSYSGDCQAGWALARRSANRGECPQICRQVFDLIDGDGRTIVKGKHLLSLRDLNRLSQLGAMVEAGVRSFKIEGRLKDAAYVKNVVAAYSRALDSIVATSDGRYCRSSYGNTQLRFTPDVAQSFNRGFTDYFTTIRRPLNGTKMASIDTPKWVGEKIGEVTHRCRGNRLAVKLMQDVANGDGISYFDSSGRFCGVRVNRAEPGVLMLASAVEIEPGTAIYRNRSKQRDDMMDGDTANRRIDVAMTLRIARNMLVLDLTCERGARASVTTMLESYPEPSKSPQKERRAAALSKTGGTIYRVGSVADECGDLFIPAGLLSDLRRRGLEALDRSWLLIRPVSLRRPADDEAITVPQHITYHHNVANRQAEDFYRRHGAEQIDKALEVSDNAVGRRCQVMTTRYCLRRELGACKLTPQGARLREPLTLRTGQTDLRLEFDCANCEMKIFT